MRRYLVFPILALSVALFSGCDVRVKSDAPPTVEKKDTTIVNPPAEKKETTIINPPAEKKVENNTTIVNPPAEKK